MRKAEECNRADCPRSGALSAIQIAVDGRRRSGLTAKKLVIGLLDLLNACTQPYTGHKTDPSAVNMATRSAVTVFLSSTSFL